MSEQERWLDKIQKLLAKAERASTEAEAEAFYAKAQELMVRWSIDETMLWKQGKSDDVIINEYMPIKRSGLFKSLVQLAAQVGFANDVRVLVRDASGWKDRAGVEFIGWKSDIERVKMLYASFMIQGAREMNRMMPAAVKGSSEAGSWRRSFRTHYAYRVGDRLMEAKRATEQQVVSESHDSNGMSLAIIDRKQAVQAFMDKIPTKAARASRSKTNWAGATAGREAADRADLGQPKMGSNRGELR